MRYRTKGMKDAELSNLMNRFERRGPAPRAVARQTSRRRAPRRGLQMSYARTARRRAEGQDR
ncbi:hypothetical protein GCM10018782_00420 [Streptomyces griseoaurantiacus]|nr:hypothetical protein GCM10018782_00420 [Streptomyces griseoaurantiacus]